jgi:hypothetical protein
MIIPKLEETKMSAIKEINDYEFESINDVDAETIKNGLVAYAALLDEDNASDQWLDNVGALELILENDADQPETLFDILELLEPLKTVSLNNTTALFRVKKLDEALSYFKEDPFIVSIIDVLHEKIDDYIEIDDFFNDLIDICNILSEQ